MITTSPAPLSLAAGGSATFTVDASGTAPLTYQWQRNGVDIAGATAASFTLPSATLADSGSLFRVIVTNSAGTAASPSAALTVAAEIVAPGIALAPQSANAFDGSTAVLSVVPTGTAPFTYSWLRNGIAIDGATDASYTTPTLALADSGVQYRAVVANASGRVTSDAAVIAVKPVPPAIATAPAATLATAGQTATFSVVASGSAPLTYQWLRNGIAVTGAVAASYTTPILTVADGGVRYSVVIGNGGGSVTSADAVLTVNAAVVAPVIASFPSSFGVQEGQTATFAVGATGTGPLVYQWLRNGAAIAGAVASSYTTGALTVAADNGSRYSVKVSNPSGTVTSAEATLTVQAASGGLVGRAWTPGQLLESNDAPVRNARLAIDDVGRAMTVFVKQSGSRYALMASRGMPNAPGVAPTWSTPVAIDVMDGTPLSGFSSPDIASFELGMSPAGNAVVYFSGGTAVTNALYATRFIAATGQWEAPVLLGTAYSSSAGRALINDQGDVAIQINVPVASGSRVGVFSRAAGESGYRLNIFDDPRVFLPMLAMDNSGHLLVATNLVSGGISHIAVNRGAVTGTFEGFSVVDTVSGTASLNYLTVGAGGQQIVVWSQNNGSTATMFAAAATGPSQPFSVTDLGRTTSTGVVVSATGQGTFMDARGGQRRRWVNGTWLAAEALPITANSGETCSLASSGDMLCINTVGGWFTYEAARNVVVQPRSITTSGGFVLGVSYGAPLTRLVAFSASGKAVESLLIRYDTLPSATLPTGVTGSADNYWGIYLK